MLRNIWYEVTAFEPGDDRRRGVEGGNLTEKDLIFFMEALVWRNMGYLKMRPSTPSLYKSGVKWVAPQQLTGDVDEVRLLRQVLGAAARRRDVARALDKIQSVLGGEHFCDIGVILELGGIDCDGIASWRVAELRQKGIPARPFMTNRARPGGGTTYHALVVWPPLYPDCPYETIEDPSLLTGMYQPERKAERDAELQKNRERFDILKRRGLSAIRTPMASASPFDGADLDAAVSDLVGRTRAA